MQPSMGQCKTSVDYKAMFLFRTRQSRINLRLPTIYSGTWLFLLADELLQVSWLSILLLLPFTRVQKKTAKSGSISPCPVTWLVWGTVLSLWFLFRLMQEVQKNVDFHPLGIGTSEVGLQLLLNTYNDKQCIRLSSSDPPRDRALNQKLAHAFLKASVSSSFITHFTYKCSFSNQFCFQDSHLFPSLNMHFYKMLMWVKTALPKTHSSALSSSVTDVHILCTNLVVFSFPKQYGYKRKYPD